MALFCMSWWNWAVKSSSMAERECQSCVEGGGDMESA
jgi:hypothetical protein